MVITHHVLLAGITQKSHAPFLVVHTIRDLLYTNHVIQIMQCTVL